VHLISLGAWLLWSGCLTPVDDAHCEAYPCSAITRGRHHGTYRECAACDADDDTCHWTFLGDDDSELYACDMAPGVYSCNGFEAAELDFCESTP
jgi:hypothetical protein